MPELNANHEVADLLNVSQFIPLKSAYECVSFSGSLLKYAGQPGHGPTGTALQASNLAEYWYGRLEGGNDAANHNGMSLSAEYVMLQGMGLHYHAVEPNVMAIKAALEQGYPLLICGAETGMYDMELGDHIPYSWQPIGNHCIVASGIAPDGTLLVHDCANVDEHGVRPGPRRYDASKLQLVSATAVTMPWLAAPAPVHSVSGVPTGWHDANNVLIAPNNVAVVHGFREYVLSHHWEPSNVPLAPEFGLDSLELANPALGKGTAQYFEECVLEYTPERGVFVAWVGRELMVTRKKLLDYYTAIKLRDERIAQIEAELEKYVNWTQSLR